MEPPVRVRWWAPTGLVPCPAGADPEEVILVLTGDDPGAAATVEADGGDGPVLSIALGRAGIVWRAEPYRFDEAVGLAARTWAVEGADEEEADEDGVRFLLAAVAQTLHHDHGVAGPRLLTAEGNDEAGLPEVLGVSWYDPSWFADEVEP